MNTNSKAATQSTVMPMIIIGLLFFMFGFVTWLNGSLIPFLQIACELTHTQAYLVTLAFYISYTVMALPMAAVLKRTGYKDAMVWGLAVMVVGALLFIPAAMARNYAFFLGALFVLGTGLTLLQTASNPYVVTIGPRESAAVRISIMGILNKGAGVISPLVFTALILTGMSEFSDAQLQLLSVGDREAQLEELSQRLISPYLMMAVALIALAAFVKFSPLKEPEFESDDAPGSVSSVLNQPHVVLGAITLFFYVGVEVIAGDTIGLFGRGLGVENFGQLTSYTMAFMVTGYIVGMVLIPRWVSQERALAASAVLGIVFCVLLIQSDAEGSGIWASLFGWTGVPAIPNVVLYLALIGLANALVWPTVWPLALEDLSPQQISTASALLIMGIAGGAILPLVYGAVADSETGPQQAYWVMLPCYAFILFFALKGHRLHRWSSK